MFESEHLQISLNQIFIYRIGTDARTDVSRKYFPRGRRKQTISLNVHKFYKKCQNSFHYYIWNYHVKCIQISINMPGIGLEMCQILRILRNKIILYGWINNGHVESIEVAHLLVIQATIFRFNTTFCPNLFQ